MDRRDFIKLSGAGALSLGLPLPAVHISGIQRVGQRTLVVIYLRGGQDPLNTIVPYSDDRYYELRPTIAIPRKDSEAGRGVIRLDKHFGLHPALAPLKPLYDAKLFAPILSVGSHHTTRSHFDAQDFMEYAAPGLRTEHNGWLNRYLTATKSKQGKDSDLRALAMQGLLPRSLRGDYPVLAVPRIRRKKSKGGDVLDAFQKLYEDDESNPMAKPRRGSRRMEKRDDDVKIAGQTTIRALRRYERVTSQIKPTKAAYPNSRFGEKLKRIAQVIRSGETLEVACADYPGWDHHANEGGTDATIARMLGDLGQSLAAFMEDIGERAEDTLVLTMTEFGRTARENGNAGTDHGHGGLMFALGGQVKGGKVHGDWPGLGDNELYKGRDLAITTDFRDVINEALVEHMDFKPPRGFFPEYRPGKGPGFLG